ncbi:hypothetical protein [Geopseudomonas aromaticivorans]
MQLPVKRLSEMQPDPNLIARAGYPSAWLLPAIVTLIATPIALWLLPGHRAAAFVVGISVCIACLMKMFMVLEDRSDRAGKLMSELYSSYLPTLDPNQLRLVAVSPEYDDATRMAVTVYLADKFPGWSLVPPNEPLQVPA